MNDWPQGPLGWAKVVAEAAIIVFVVWLFVWTFVALFSPHP